MARGFESKDVEYQQAEAERKHQPRSPSLTAEQREAEAKRRTIELSLARKRAELALANSGAHRQMLAAAIDALEQELKRLS